MANYNIQKESTLHVVLDRKAVEPNIQKESTLHLVLDRRVVELWRITISRRSQLSILY